MKIVSLNKDATERGAKGAGSGKRAVDSSCQNATSVPASLRLQNRCDPLLHIPALCLLSRGSQVRGNNRSATYWNITIGRLLRKISWGKITLLVYIFAIFTHKRYFCALVGTDDAFDCIRAEAAGMALDKVLLICCKQRRKEAKIRSFKSFINSTASNNEQNCRKNIVEKQWKKIQQSSSANWTDSEQSQNFNSLELAFKTADILLHSRGFALIAVDLSCIDEARLRKVPLTTWFRFARVAEDMQTALVFLTSSPIAYRCVGLKLHVNGCSTSWPSKETKHHESCYAPESSGVANHNNSTTKHFRGLVEQYG